MAKAKTDTPAIEPSEPTETPVANTRAEVRALSGLEYPRLLHMNDGHEGNPTGSHLSVASADDAAAAVKQGWSVEPFPPNYDPQK